MWVRILGSAAGGGFPQWNCNCPNCCAVRNGSPIHQFRTQCSIAISSDYEHWFLINASPDLRFQIESFPLLRPQKQVRLTRIQAVVLSDAELDHTLGLLMLREARCLRVYATEWVHDALSSWNPIMRTLRTYCSVDWQPVKVGEMLTLSGPDCVDSGLTLEAFSTFSKKAPAFVADRVGSAECSVIYRISNARKGGVLVYAPSVQELSPEIQAQLVGCHIVLFDGSFWDDDELVRLGIGNKTARMLGHLPICGEHGSLEQLTKLNIRRKIYVHLNNTNPLLNENSDQRHAVEESGLEVAFDGMEMEV